MWRQKWKDSKSDLSCCISHGCMLYCILKKHMLWWVNCLFKK
jgi:hypothetical protein